LWIFCSDSRCWLRQAPSSGIEGSSSSPMRAASTAISGERTLLSGQVGSRLHPPHRGSHGRGTSRIAASSGVALRAKGGANSWIARTSGRRRRTRPTSALGSAAPAWTFASITVNVTAPFGTSSPAPNARGRTAAASTTKAAPAMVEAAQLRQAIQRPSSSNPPIAASKVRMGGMRALSNFPGERSPTAPARRPPRCRSITR
jgi:hypothetical protein